MDSKKVPDFLYEKESYIIRGACFRVYNELGGGIQEKIIERTILIDVFYNKKKLACIFLIL